MIDWVQLYTNSVWSSWSLPRSSWLISDATMMMSDAELREMGRYRRVANVFDEDSAVEILEPSKEESSSPDLH